jgi:hypothetical protein
MAETEVTVCKCSVSGCPKTARWQIGFRIWPAGISNRVKANSLGGITGVLVCDEHAIRDPEKFFTARGKERMAMGFLEGGRGMPDFSTAQIIHTQITEGEPITAAEAMRLAGFPDSDAA